MYSKLAFTYHVYQFISLRIRRWIVNFVYCSLFATARFPSFVLIWFLAFFHFFVLVWLLAIAASWEILQVLVIHGFEEKVK
jgi:hypothetical protein